jgi:hypothetical protein
VQVVVALAARLVVVSSDRGSIAEVYRGEAKAPPGG